MLSNGWYKYGGRRKTEIYKVKDGKVTIRIRRYAGFNQLAGKRMIYDPTKYPFPGYWMEHYTQEKEMEKVWKANYRKAKDVYLRQIYEILYPNDDADRLVQQSNFNYEYTQSLPMWEINYRKEHNML